MHFNPSYNYTLVLDNFYQILSSTKVTDFLDIKDIHQYRQTCKKNSKTKININISQSMMAKLNIKNIQIPSMLYNVFLQEPKDIEVYNECLPVSTIQNNIDMMVVDFNYKFNLYDNDLNGRIIDLTIPGHYIGISILFFEDIDEEDLTPICQLYTYVLKFETRQKLEEIVAEIIEKYKNECETIYEKDSVLKQYERHMDIMSEIVTDEQYEEYLCFDF